MSRRMRIEGYNFEFSEIPGAVPALRATVDAAQWREACRRAAFDGGRLVALWGSDDAEIGTGLAVHAALLIQPGLPCITLPLGGRALSRTSAIFSPPPTACSAPSTICSGLVAEGAADERASGCGTPRGRRTSFRCAKRFCRSRSHRSPVADLKPTPIRLCRSPATACTKSPSARCMPAPSSPATSVSASSASACCGSKSGWATSTRASKSASNRWTCWRARGWRRAFPAIRRLLMRGRMRWRSKAQRAQRRRRGRCGCAHCCSSASASPTISAILVSSATMRALLSDLRSSPVSRRTCCA